MEEIRVDLLINLFVILGGVIVAWVKINTVTAALTAEVTALKEQVGDLRAEVRQVQRELTSSINELSRVAGQALTEVEIIRSHIQTMEKYITYSFSKQDQDIKDVKTQLTHGKIR